MTIWEEIYMKRREIDALEKMLLDMGYLRDREVPEVVVESAKNLMSEGWRRP